MVEVYKTQNGHLKTATLKMVSRLDTSASHKGMSLTLLSTICTQSGSWFHKKGA